MRDIAALQRGLLLFGCSFWGSQLVCWRGWWGLFLRDNGLFYRYCSYNHPL